MTRRPQTFLLLSAVIVTLVSELSALKLPYEVLETIIELSNHGFKGLNRVNVSDDRGSTARPIYRLDLDPKYIAYYEIDMGRNYVVLSAGRKTGDYREVESGPDPRPTNVLIRQAQRNGQRCETFYRLSPLGLTVCMNDNGTAVAASYNWTADVPEIEDWRQLDQMVKESLDDSLDGFNVQWRERAAQRRSKSDWATTDVVPKGGEMKKTDRDEEALSPGSIVKVALGESYTSVHVYITNSGNSRMRPSSRPNWQQRLCKVLVDVCPPDGTTKVNPSAIKKTPNNISYLKLEVHGNLAFVRNVLKRSEIGFVVEIKEGKEVIKKHFAIDLHSNRVRRSSGCGTACKESVSAEYDFPDYDQHKCCGGCYSGCGPVAWAQVFAYYDRRASYSKFSPTLYGDSSTKAPLYLTDEVKSFVEDIRKQVKTFCDDGQGATKTSEMHLIAPWFRARQGSKSWVVDYLEKNRRKRSSGGGSSVKRGDRSWIQSKAVEYIKIGYPVILSFTTESKAGHAAVATQYKGTSRRYRHCTKKTTGWWMGKRTKTVCSWKTAHDYEFYLHYGWGGYNNKWQQVSPFGAHVAYLTK